MARAILAVMAAEKTPERSIAPSEVTVTITILPPVHGHRFEKRLAAVGVLHKAGALLGVVLALAALGMVIAIALRSNPTGRPVGGRRARGQDAERAAIAAAFGYPYPHRCLTITISASNPDYARADVDRAKRCGRYHGYVNASFHRTDGTWRLVLDEGQQFVPNSLLTPCRAGRAGCARRRTSGWGRV